MKKLIIVIAAFTMVAGFAMTAAAADWNFYGNARIETFYTDTDTLGQAEDDQTYEQGLASNSRVGANVKVSDELTARFEYGSGPNLRLLYGKWNFGAGSLLVGQDYTPVMMAFSNQVYAAGTGLIGFGAPYGGRVPQLKLRFGDFEMAAIQPTSVGDIAADAAVVATTGALGAQADAIAAGYADSLAWDTAAAVYAANISFEYTLPRLEASYFYDAGPLRLRVQGGYSTVDVIDRNGASEVSEDIDAYILALGATYATGPFYVTATYSTGENLTVLGIATTAPSVPDATGDGETDMYQIFAGYKMNDMFGFEAGFGKEETEIGSAQGQEATSWYVQSSITLAPGVFIVPEIGNMDTEEVNGKDLLYYGLKWQINF